MERIKVHDKTFEKFLDYEKIETAIKQLADDVHRDFSDSVPVFLCVLKGSFMFASELFKNYQGAAEITFIRVASYTGTQTTGAVHTLFELNEDIKNRDVIILEDIIDSGITIKHLVEELENHRPRRVKVATLLIKPDAVSTDIQPDYVGLEIPNDFIVGFGLDYNGLGRNTRDIYKIVDD